MPKMPKITISYFLRVNDFLSRGSATLSNLRNLRNLRTRK